MITKFEGMVWADHVVCVAEMTYIHNLYKSVHFEEEEGNKPFSSAI